MNYCRKCQSDYEKPGSCNCFAEQPPRQAAPPVYVPYPYPFYPSYPGTIIGGSVSSSGTTATILWNGPIASGSVPYDVAIRASAGVSFTVGGSC